MLWFSVTLCLLAVAFPGLATGKVVGKGESGFAECDGFFYAHTPPAGFLQDPAEQVKICQKYEREPRFATLYSTRDKIPLYSAFRYTEAAAPSREQKWMVEPQIDDPESKLDGMMPEAEVAHSLAHLGRNQALMADYAESGYEKGQLNPSSLHKGDQQVATYTLTNAVPMVSPLEEIWHWEVENLVSRGFAPHCKNGKDLYLVSGAVPSTTKAKDKVAVPESLWLAACCDDGSEAWSLGFIKQATTGNNLEDLTVEALEKKLPRGTQLFKNKCGEERHNAKKQEAVLNLVKKIQAEAPVPKTKKSTKDHKPPAAKEEKGFLKKIFNYVVAPLFQLIKFIFHIVGQIAKYIFYFVWRIIMAIVKGLYTFIKGIATALLCIFVNLAQVGIDILNGIAKHIYNVLMVTYHILSIPIHLILDIVSFPFHVLGAVPGVLKDIASGFGKAVLLFINGITHFVTGLSHVLSHLAKKLFPKFCDV